jgi:hypothetical protein
VAEESVGKRSLYNLLISGQMLFEAPRFIGKIIGLSEADFQKQNHEAFYDAAKRKGQGDPDCRTADMHPPVRLFIRPGASV